MFHTVDFLVGFVAFSGYENNIFGSANFIAILIASFLSGMEVYLLKFWGSTPASISLIMAAGSSVLGLSDVIIANVDFWWQYFPFQIF